MIALLSSFAAGSTYACGLWLLAAKTARRRSLPLGGFPWWLVGLCGAAAAAIGLLAAPGAALLLASSLIGAAVCALVDARSGYIFDALTLVMTIVGIVAASRAGRFTDGAIAVTVVGSLLAGLYVLTRCRGIGLGDVKLGSALALGYGLIPGIVAIGSAFVLGAAYALVLVACGRARRSDSLRFGPFIAAGAAVAPIVGSFIWWR